MISAGLGRYGPFVLHDGTYANLESIEDVFSIGLNRAVSVIAEKVSKGRGARNGGTPAALKELGEHPDGGKITVRDGKYGPYVNHEKINATLPKGKDPMSVTLEDAVALIAEKAAKGGGGRKPFRKDGRRQDAALQRRSRLPKRLPRRKRPEALARRISGTGSSRAGKTAGPAKGAPKGDFRPTREDILKYIHENPDRSGKREIAKAFSLKGDDRIWLKDMLRDLQDEGLLNRERKRLTRAGSLPHVSVLEVYSRDADGGLLARPSEWNERFGEPPIVSLRPSRSGPAPGIGDRVLAKTFPSDEAEGPAYTGRVMKVFEKRAEAVLGVLRQADDGTFRIEPVERRQPEMTVSRATISTAPKRAIWSRSSRRRPAATACRADG